MADRDERGRSYWRAQLKLLVVLLAVWFLVSFGMGILWVEPLNEIKMWGFPLGFWFAQQGSIYTFVAMLVVYALLSDRLARRHGVE